METSLVLPGYDENDIFVVPKGITKADAYRIHHGNELIAGEDIRNAEVRARYHAFMVYFHDLWKSIIDPNTNLPVYRSWVDWVEAEGAFGLSTYRKYIGQMRMLYAAGITRDELENASVSTIEYLWNKAVKAERLTGQVSGFEGQPRNMSLDDINGVIKQAITETGFEFDAPPDTLKKEALHQLVNPLEPRLWVEREEQNGFVFKWNKVTYPDGGVEQLSGKFSISFQGQPPGDVVAHVMKLLKVF